jgi:hypothetical protein
MHNKVYPEATFILIVVKNVYFPDGQVPFLSRLSPSLTSRLIILVGRQRVCWTAASNGHTVHCPNRWMNASVALVE